MHSISCWAKSTEFAVIAGRDESENRAVLETIARSFGPHRIVIPATPEQAASLAAKVPLLANRPAREGRTTTYICENMTCQAPVVGVDALKEALAASGA